MVGFTAVSEPIVPPTVNSEAGESSDSAEVALDDSAADDDDKPKSVDVWMTLRRTMMLRIHLAGMPRSALRQLPRLRLYQLVRLRIINLSLLGRRLLEMPRPRDPSVWRDLVKCLDVIKLEMVMISSPSISPW